MFAPTYDDGKPPDRPFATPHPAELANRPFGIHPYPSGTPNPSLGNSPNRTGLAKHGWAASLVALGTRTSRAEDLEAAIDAIASVVDAAWRAGV